MKCVTSVRFTIKVNGELLPFFDPTRGLHQGCPMYPYLFLICAQGLTALLNNYGGAHIDREVRVSIHAPWVNHLFFAADSLILRSANAQSADRLNAILRIYAECSGQAVNREKSSIFSSANAGQPLREILKNSLGIMVEASSKRYLGLPRAIGRITSVTFNHIGDRVRNKIGGWSE